MVDFLGMVWVKGMYVVVDVIKFVFFKYVIGGRCFKCFCYVFVCVDVDNYFG